MHWKLLNASTLKIAQCTNWFIFFEALRKSEDGQKRLEEAQRQAAADMEEERKKEQENIAKAIEQTRSDVEQESARKVEEEKQKAVTYPLRCM